MSGGGEGSRRGAQRDQRLHDVRRVMAAARALLDDPSRRGRLAEALVASTGLSRAGVELALDRHVERDASDAELEALVALAGQARCVSVILSANAFVGALRAIACARAAAPRVVVRPSSREPAFALALVAACADPAITSVERLALEAVEGEVHVYGRDETVASVRAAVRPGIRVRGHGAGMGIACVGEDDDLADAAWALAEDVAPFDQRGCLSPRVVLSLGGEERASRFARALHEALAAMEVRVPRGELGADERAEAARYADTLRFAGALYEGPAHLVGVADELVLAPPGRHVHVVSVRDDAVARTLAPLEPAVTTLGGSPAALDALRPFVRHPDRIRWAALGRMQRPPLDGPVDRRPW